LKPAVIALARQKVHLQKALDTTSSALQSGWNLDGALDFREIQTLAFPT